MPYKKRDRCGQNINGWIIVKRDSKCAANGDALWIARCPSCGNEVSRTVFALRSRKTCASCRTYNVGQIINGWQLTRVGSVGSAGDRRWFAKCFVCGEEFERSLTSIRRSNGCHKCASCRKSGVAKVNLKGRLFGRLLVIEYVGGRRWKCMCTCGNSHTASYASLIRRRTTSCGCLLKELCKSRGLAKREGITLHEAASYEREQSELHNIEEEHRIKVLQELPYSDAPALNAPKKPAWQAPVPSYKGPSIPDEEDG
jgi:hypothetical protein